MVPRNVSLYSNPSMNANKKLVSIYVSNFENNANLAREFTSILRRYTDSAVGWIRLSVEVVGIAEEAQYDQFHVRTELVSIHAISIHTRFTMYRVNQGVVSGLLSKRICLPRT